MSGKEEIYYNIIFDVVIDILTQGGLYKLHVNFIVTDSEKAPVNAVTKNFLMCKE